MIALLLLTLVMVIGLGSVALDVELALRSWPTGSSR